MGYLAVDIGATNLRVASGDDRRLNSKISESTDRKNGPYGISDQIVRLAGELSISELRAVGIGSIGPIDLASGRIVDTPNLPFKDIPIVNPLQEAFSVPVAMLNDCSAAVLGEQRFGAGKGVRNLVYITLSTGIGGGALVDGHLLRGKDGNAVEIGHLTIDPQSRLRCGCGCMGHWEAYASGSGIPNFVSENLEPGDADSLMLELAGGDPGGITAEILFEAAERGDSTAIRLVRMLGEVNAIGLADVVNLFDPEMVTIGGSIALNHPRLILEPIQENIDRHLINREPEIIITPLGEDAVLYGALAHATSLME
ncbi:MAG: ROK family protein [Candidatus Bathyarchaeota archaeon]|jgi:glucokinase